MNGMKIDLRTIKVWVAKWEKSNGVTKTASQLAAVMLSKTFEENEKRIVRIENLMKDIIREHGTLQKIERQICPPAESKPRREQGMESELKEHRRKIVALLKEADEALKVPAKSSSILVGGLLLEINK